jgi:predicted Fe-Mo cluster-binding NifX family protein
MKVCVTAAGPGLDAPLDPRFGRCAYFVVVEAETMEAESI